MAEAKQSSQWGPVAMLASILANVNRDPKRRAKPFTADEFNPFAKPTPRAKTGVPLTRDAVAMLKTIFVDNQPGK